jgi:uncharacterized protein YjdB
MTKNKLLVLAAITSLLGACGGRSMLKAHADAGPVGDGGWSPDGKRDALLQGDVLLPADGPLDRAAADVRGAEAADASQPDGRRPDAIADVARRETRGETGGGGDAAPSLATIEIAPPSVTIAVGMPFGGFVITAVYSDGSTADVTSQATLTSGDTAIVLVSGRTLTGLKAGTTTVRASFAGLGATATVTVTDSPLQSITIDGAAPLAVGGFLFLTATGVYADGTKQDITAKAVWTSSDATLATLALDSATGKEKLTGLAAGSLSVGAALSGITGKVAITVTAAAMTRIDITPAQPIMQQGLARALQATATYADGTTGDVTLQAIWASSNSAIAAVTAGATAVVVKAIAAGTATISATVGTISGSITITVTSPTLGSIALTPATWSPGVGGTQAFTATGTYADGSTADVSLSATWSSSDSSIVSVSNATSGKGQATALAVGSAQIQATLSGVSGQASVTVSASPLVSITITPDPVALVPGLEANLVATGAYQNGTTQVMTSQVAWWIADAGIATVANGAGTAGQITGIAPGTTTVYAALSGITGKAVVVVSQAKLLSITVTPTLATVPAGVAQPFRATGSYDNGSTPDLTTQVTWGSSDIAVAQVSNAAGSNGLATSLVAGTTTITASLGGMAGKATLTVGDPLLSSVMISPTSASIQIGNTQTFTVTAVYQNGTTAAVDGTWASANPSVATIAANGNGRRAVATGVAAGTTTITVTYEGLTASAQLTVVAEVTLVGLTITPAAPPSLLVGATQQFRANAIYSDGSTTNVTDAATWTTSDAGIASVSNAGGGGGGGGGGRGGPAGRATGIGAGTATITGTYAGFAASVSLTVRDPALVGLLVTPASATVKLNGTQQFTAVATYEDGTSATVTNATSWTTSDGSIASITSGGGGGGGGGRGLATGLAVGTVTITGTYNGFAATAKLTVSAATPTSLVVTPALATILVGQTQAFVATLVYSDNTTAIVTGSATWSSSDASVATVTIGAGGGRAGGATGMGVGTSTITASYDGLSGSATLTVTDPPLAFVQVTPTNPSIPVLASLQFVATAVFKDNTTRNVTAQATWSSSDTGVAVVTTAGANLGRATAVAEGASIISATYQGISGSSLLTVAGSVQSVSVTPANPTTVLGVPVVFAATAILSNNTTFVATGSAAWVSSDAAVATVTAGGVATPLKSGTATITATFLGKSGSSVLTVSAATKFSISISPASLTLGPGQSQQLTATGAYSDGGSYDLTNAVTWLSSVDSVASVSNASGSRGLLTAIAAGTTNVTAAFQGIASTPLLVSVK